MPERRQPSSATSEPAPPAVAAPGPEVDRARELPTTTERPPDAPAARQPAPAADALRLVAEASAVLAGSPDLDEALAAIGRLIVPRLGDVCLLDLDAAPDAPAERRVMAAALDGGSPEQVELLRQRHAPASLVVPLRARGRALGAMTVVRTASPNAPPEGDVALARELGHRVAEAVDAARLTAALRHAAEERERLAEQARHAQRVETLGAVAGGVAHDFNNLLTVILTTLDLVRADVPRAAHADLDVVRGAAARASQLTRQLLAFGRRQALDTRLVELNAVVGDAQALLRRLVGERVAFGLSLAPRPLPVRADPGELEQVLVNLVLNARDAVTRRPGGGLVTVDTEEVALGTDAAARLGVAPGRYVAAVVHDSGVGMDDETRGRAFEPFFTTKPLGEGTGLGLSTVYAIVARCGGVVDVESAPGRGSTFRVLLPRADADSADDAARPAEPAPAPRGGETVLLVEDEAAVRGVARRVLERAGYAVLEARHGADALLVWREQGGARGAIDVLLTDVRMPELGGRELADRLRHERPGLPVVFVSGYLPDAASGAGGAERFVSKPFVAPELQRAVRQVLDATRSAA